MASISHIMSALFSFDTKLGSLYSSLSFFSPASPLMISSRTFLKSQSMVHLHLWWNRKAASCQLQVVLCHIWHQMPAVMHSTDIFFSWLLQNIADFIDILVCENTQAVQFIETLLYHLFLYCFWTESKAQRHLIQPCGYWGRTLCYLYVLYLLIWSKETHALLEWSFWQEVPICMDHLRVFLAFFFCLFII